MMFWLPIQDAVADFSPHCIHRSNSGHGLNANVNPTADNELHNVDHRRFMDVRMASGKPCEVNPLCHASCSTLISAAYPSDIFISNSSVHQLRNVNVALFIPDLPQRPPRV